VNSRITGRQHATRDKQAHFCGHAEILCNSKVIIKELLCVFAVKTALMDEHQENVIQT
jgi:hypothetical protein